ncbi:MAG: hypothetical protein P8M70_05085 [Verrucomicrobiota bacterium]|nr:hypothetical protein [Verrucomicrobiota bacterium]
MRSDWGEGAVLATLAVANAAAEVLRKSRRDALISQAYEIPLGSQAYFAMLRGQ